MILLSSIFLPVSRAATQTYYLGYQGPITGPEAIIGIDQMNAVKYAIKKFNLENPNIQVKLVEIDDQGDPAIAIKVAPAVGGNNLVLGIVGPAYSASTITSLPYYKAGGLTLISPSATRISLTNPASADFGGPIFHRMSSSDAKQGSSLTDLALTDVTAPKIFLVDDRSSYGVDLASYVKSSIFSVAGATLVGTASVFSTETDLLPTIAKIKATGANVVIYLGYFPQAAILVRQLRESGSKAIFASGDGVLVPEFIKLAGNSSEGARITGVAGLADVSQSEESNYVKLMGSSSGYYAVESIDATNIYLSGILAGATTREKMLAYVKKYSGVSVKGNSIRFTTTGDLATDSFTKFQVIGGVFKAMGQVQISPISASPSPLPSQTSPPPLQPSTPPIAVITVMPTPKSSANSRQTTITCVKGKVTKKVTGINPKCPSGYLKKI